MFSLIRWWLFVTIILGYFAAPAQAQTTNCGSSLSSYRGVSALSNDPYQASEQDCAGLGTYGDQYQCTEFVRRFYHVIFGADTEVPAVQGTSPWRGNAGTYFDTATRRGLVPFRNGGTAPPAPDDILVFTSVQHVAGHVAIVTSVNSDFIEIIEQNWSPSGVARLPLSFDSSGYSVTRIVDTSAGPQPSSFAVAGWLREPAAANQNSVIGGTYFDRDLGLIGTAFLFNPQVAHLSSLGVEGPAGWNANGTLTCGVDQPQGIATDKSICWQFIPPVTGTYTAIELVQAFTINASGTMAPPQITSTNVTHQAVAMTWVADTNSLSFLVRVNPAPFSGAITKEMIVPGNARTATLNGLSLVTGTQYQAVVFAFSNDVQSPGPLVGQFQVSAHAVSFVAP
jgi:surface antigen